MRRKIASVLLYIIILGISLVGCQNEGSDDSREDEDTKTVLTMWTIATENDAFNTPFVKAIEDYEAAYPNIKIEMESFENQAYKTKIKAAVASNELPDIFFTWGGGFSKSFVESGKVLPLTEYYEHYEEELSEAAVSYATYDGILYGTTYVAPVSMLFYNQTIFKEQGLQPPKTWEELIQVCEILKDKGITPIALSAKDTWGLAMIHDVLALKSAGHEKVQKALTKDGQRYSTPEFLVAANKLGTLIDMEVFNGRAAELSNDEAQTTFIEGKAAMYIMGSWTGGVISTDAENLADFDVVPVPVISERAAETDFMGGAVDTLMVNAKTKDKDIAANAAFEIAKSVSKYAFLEGAGIAAWTTNYDTSDVNPLSSKIANYTKGATSFTLWFDTLMEAEDAAEYLRLLQEFYAGDIDAEGFVISMDIRLSE